MSDSFLEEQVRRIRQLAERMTQMTERREASERPQKSGTHSVRFKMSVTFGSSTRCQAHMRRLTRLLGILAGVAVSVVSRTAFESSALSASVDRSARITCVDR